MEKVVKFINHIHDGWGWADLEYVLDNDSTMTEEQTWAAAILLAQLGMLYVHSGPNGKGDKLDVADVADYMEEQFGAVYKLPLKQ